MPAHRPRSGRRSSATPPGPTSTSACQCTARRGAARRGRGMSAALHSARLALRPQRARTALRRRRRAHRGAEFHQSLVENARAVRRLDEPRCLAPGPAFVRRASRLRRVRRKPRHHAQHVAVDDGHALPVHDARDGTGRVAADAGESLQLGRGGRHGSPVEVTHRASRAMEEPRAPVVAKALPCREHVVLGGVGERAGRREPLHEPRERIDHPPHLGLLQHQFAHQRAVAGSVPAPGKVAGGGREPRLQGLGNPPRVGDRRGRQRLGWSGGTGLGAAADRHGGPGRLRSDRGTR
jgi:hypothetical protein